MMIAEISKIYKQNDMKGAEYKSKAGSRVITDGYYIQIYFDWIEEDDACVDCEPNVDPAEVMSGVLSWTCEVCGGGCTEIRKVE